MEEDSTASGSPRSLSPQPSASSLSIANAVESYGAGSSDSTRRLTNPRTSTPSQQESTPAVSLEIQNSARGQHTVNGPGVNLDEEERDERGEWRSWKIHYLYLSLLLIIEIFFIITITALLVVSRNESGFARESNPPTFLVHRPTLRKIVWEQGILYTAIPAFIMTVYRTMWDSCVMAIADWQPYVDLKNGGHPRSTILLDYKVEPILYRWAIAIRNSHFSLAACLASSLLMLFTTIPLASFLFIMDSASLESTFQLSLDTTYNATVLKDFPKGPRIPNFRQAIDSAASAYLQNSSLPPWTDRNFAFPTFNVENTTSQGNITLDIIGHRAHAECRAIPDSEYTKWIHRVPGTEGYQIEIFANDRDCEIRHSLRIGTDFWSPRIFLTSWHTPSCSAASGYSRTSVMSASYNHASAEIQNFTLISCKISYFNVSGLLTTRFTASSSSPSIITFRPSAQNATQDQSAFKLIRLSLETYIHHFQCFDMETNVDGSELVKHIYKIAKRMSPTEPLQPDILAEATQAMLQTSYAVFAATNLFFPLDPPTDGTGTHTIEEKRLFVIEPVAYVILATLSVTAMLNIRLLFYCRQASILKEEPYGLLSAAGILHQSAINKNMIPHILEKDSEPRRARTTATELYRLDDCKCFWDHCEQKIKVDPLEMQEMN